MFANGITQQYFKLLSFFVLFLSLISFPSKGVTASYVANGSSLKTEEFLYSSDHVEQSESFQQNTTGAECNCGSLYSEGCYFVNGKKVCNCIEGYAQNKDTCQECNCEPYRTKIRLHSCYFKDGNKVCKCLDGYTEFFGICAKCDCGLQSLKCEFNGMSKTCICKNGYIEVDGKCTDPKGCHCGLWSTKCEIEGNSTKCTCYEGFVQKNDKCVECDCGPKSLKCEFKGNSKTCTCKSGYIEVDGKCSDPKECNCGFWSRQCKIVGNSKKCTCHKGYVQKDGQCVACDCGPNSFSCFIDWLGTKKCTCEVGYIAKSKSLYSSDETCTKIKTSSMEWRIATYIEGFIFGIIISCLLLFIKTKRCG